MLASFILFILAWTVFVPLSGAAIAPGVVSIDGNSKKIQHLEGGIIRELYIKDGDQVIAGQPLILLDKIQAEEEYNSLRSQLILASTRYARLMAEETMQDQISFPEWLLAARPDSIIDKAINKQNESFINRHEDHQEKIRILKNRMERLKNQYSQLRASLTVQKRQLALTRDELLLNQGFMQKGLITRRDLFRLKNNEVSIEIEIREKRSQLAGIKQQISQLKLQETDLISSRNTFIAQQSQKDQESIVKLKHQLSKIKDTLSRTTIKAPVSGTVVNLKKHTIGGVVSAGEEILDIVPTGQKLLVDAHVEPKDRDVIQPGQKAEVRFSAFNQRVLRPVKGIVKIISADSLADPITKSPYYLAKIELIEDPATVLK